MVPPRRAIAVIGQAVSEPRRDALAEEVGRRIAEAGAVLLTGGRGGVMAAASRGARKAGGTVVGVLPGEHAGQSPPNEDVEIALFTGLGQARNLVLVLSAGAAIAIGGGWGTLSEIALARKHGKPVILLESWSMRRPDSREEDLPTIARTADEAVQAALASLTD